MQTFSMTDIGKMRNTNQDYLLCESNEVGKFPNLFMVADGMGGHNAGDTASRIAVEQVFKKIGESEKITPVSIWGDSLQKANAYVYNFSQKSKEYEGMGTTFVGVTIFDHTAYVANIGDSRLYRLHGTLNQITEDHSLVEEMLRNGGINAEEKDSHPKKNVITRALGATEIVKPDFFEVDVKEGDVVLLCSDGLNRMLEDSKIEEIIKRNMDNMEAATKELVGEANRAGGKDNISVILIRI